MIYVKIILLALQILKAIVDYVERQKLINDAERKLIRDGLEAIDARLQKVHVAGDAARERLRAGSVSDADIGFRDEPGG